MMGRTHLAIGFLAALLVLPFVQDHDLAIFVMLVLLGAILPDIDHGGSTINNMVPLTKIVPFLFAHRGFFHSIFPPMIIYIVAYAYGAAWVGAAIVIGYCSHLASDACTRLGVNLLHPFSRFQVKGFMQTGGIAEFGVLIFVVALNMYLIARRIL